MSRLIGGIAYLDTNAVGEVLEVVEGGLLVGFRRDRERTDESKSQLRAAFAGVGAEYAKTSAKKDDTAGDFTATPAGNLGRLYNLLDERNRVSLILGSDEQAWRGLEEGEFIECNVATSIAPFHALLEDADNLMSKFAQMAPLMGEEKAKEITQTQQQMAMIKQVFSLQGALPVFMQPTDDDAGPRRFWASLDTEAAIYRPKSIVGSGVVLGRVRRILGQRESVDLLRFGNLTLPRESVRSLVTSMNNNPLGRSIKLSDLKVTAPAVELQVLAIVV